MPARNSLVIDTLAATPKMTKPMLGGMIGPMMPAAAISPPERALSCPALTIIGISSAASAAASATAEPDSADEDAGGDDRDVAEAAADVADERQRDVDDALRQAADVHDLAGQHEERHRHQREAVGAVDHVLREDLRVEDVEVPHQRDAADAAARRRSACRSPWRPAARTVKTAMVMLPVTARLLSCEVDAATALRFS